MDDIFGDNTNKDVFAKPEETKEKPVYKRFNNLEVEPKAIDTDNFVMLANTYSTVCKVDVDDEVKEKFKEVAKSLAKKGYKYRYDCDPSNKIGLLMYLQDTSNAETYQLWKTANKSITNPTLDKPIQPGAYEHASYYHNGYAKVGKDVVRIMFARDIHILTGTEFKVPLRFLLAYTPDGVETKEKIEYKTTGFASYHIATACELGIPVFNLKNDDAITRLGEYLSTLENK